MPPTRSSSWATTTGRAARRRAGSIDPLSGPRLRPDGHRPRLHGPRQPVPGDPRACRGTGAPGPRPTSPSARATPERARSTATAPPSTTRASPPSSRQYGRRWDAVEQSPYVVYRRENCTRTYGCVTSWRQVYYDDGASLKLRLALVNDYGLRGAGMWALGYDGGHPELYRAFAESFLVDKSAPQAGVRMLAGAQARRGLRRHLGGQGHEPRRRATTSRSRSTAAGGRTWLSRDEGHVATSGSAATGTGYAFRVRARDSRGNVGSLQRRAPSSTRRPSLAAGGFGRVVDGRPRLPHRPGHRRRPGSGTLDAGTIVAVTRGPVSADGYTWYEVTQPIREWNPVTFVERGVWVAARSSDDHATSPPTARRTAPASTRGSPASTSAAARPRSARRPRRRRRAVLARRRRLGGHAPAPLDERRRDRRARPQGLPDGRDAGRLGRRSAALAAGARTWDWNGRARRHPRRRTAATSSQLVGHGRAAGPTRAPSARPVTAAQVARLRRHRRHRGPGGVIRLGVRRRSSRPTATGPATATRLALDGQRGHPLDGAHHERRGHGRPHRVGGRRHGRPDLGRPGRRHGARVRRRPLHRDRSPPGTTAGNAAHARPGRSPSTRPARRSSPTATPRDLLAERRRRRRPDDPRLDGATRRPRAPPASTGERRSSARGRSSGVDGLGGDLERAERRRRRRARRHVHVPGQRVKDAAGNRRTVRPRRSSWTGRRAPCAGPGSFFPQDARRAPAARRRSAGA